METLATVQPLILRLVNQYRRKLGAACPYDDIMAVAQVAAWKALQRPRDSHVNWQAYLYIRVRGAIRDELRGLRPGGWRHPVEVVAMSMDTVLDHEGAVPVDLRLDVEALAARLPERKRLLLRALLAGHKLCDVSAEMGFGGARGSQLLNEVRRYFREELGQ